MFSRLQAISATLSLMAGPTSQPASLSASEGKGEGGGGGVAGRRGLVRCKSYETSLGSEHMVAARATGALRNPRLFSFLVGRELGGVDGHPHTRTHTHKVSGPTTSSYFVLGRWATKPALLLHGQTSTNGESNTRIRSCSYRYKWDAGLHGTASRSLLPSPVHAPSSGVVHIQYLTSSSGLVPLLPMLRLTCS